MPVLGRKFVVVGGAGFIGSTLARTLIEDHSIDVIVCDRLGHVDDGKWANLPAAIDDLWTPESLLKNLNTAWRDIAGVVLLADDGHENQNCDALFEACYHMPRAVWDVCVVKQRPIAWASSAHVYGNGPSSLSCDPVDIARLNPITAFGRAKQAFDLFAARQGVGPDAPPISTGLRLSSDYGRGETHKGKLASLPARAMAAAHAGTALTLAANETALTRDWVHVDDAVAAIAALIKDQNAGFFDIGTGVAVSTLNLIAQVEAVTATSLPLDTTSTPQPPRASLPPANIRPLREAGIKVAFRALDQGLRDL